MRLELHLPRIGYSMTIVFDIYGMYFNFVTLVFCISDEYMSNSNKTVRQYYLMSFLFPKINTCDIIVPTFYLTLPQHEKDA